MLAEGKSATFFDLESLPNQRRLQNPQLVLGTLQGLVILKKSNKCVNFLAHCAR
jgi:hypothetical protein